MAIDATKSGANSNSYVTTTEAAAFFAGLYGSGLWDALSDANKEKVLRTAADEIDRLPINSSYTPAVSTQALRFPVSTGNASYDGWTEVKDAVCWQVLHILENHNAITEGRTNSISGVKSEGFGGASKSFTGFNMLKRWHPNALEDLGYYTDFSLKTHRYEHSTGSFIKTVAKD